MEIRKLHEHEIKDFYAHHIQRDFPIFELRPLTDILRLLKEDLYVCYGYFKEANLIAYACFASTPELPYALLDYFAVIPGQRSNGQGGQFLQALKEILPHDGLFIEAEAPEKVKDLDKQQLRCRRIDFYKRNGAILTNVKGPLFGTYFSILYFPITEEITTDEQILQGIMSIYREITPALLFKLFVKYKISLR